MCEAGECSAAAGRRQERLRRGRVANHSRMMKQTLAGQPCHSRKKRTSNILEALFLFGAELNRSSERKASRELNDAFLVVNNRICIASRSDAAESRRGDVRAWVRELGMVKEIE